MGRYGLGSPAASSAHPCHLHMGGYDCELWRGIASIAATPGLYSWDGLSTSTLTQAINQTVASYTWAGTTAGITQNIAATPGLYSWDGLSSSTITQVINHVLGAFTWAGTTATVTVPSGPIQATVGGYNWAGSLATFGTVAPVGNLVRGGSLRFGRYL